MFYLYVTYLTSAGLEEMWPDKTYSGPLLKTGAEALLGLELWGSHFHPTSHPSWFVAEAHYVKRLSSSLRQ